LRFDKNIINDKNTFIYHFLEINWNVACLAPVFDLRRKVYRRSEEVRLRRVSKIYFVSIHRMNAMENSRSIISFYCRGMGNVTNNFCACLKNNMA
jgi:hypothetical protein